MNCLSVARYPAVHRSERIRNGTRIHHQATCVDRVVFFPYSMCCCVSLSLREKGEKEKSVRNVPQPRHLPRRQSVKVQPHHSAHPAIRAEQPRSRPPYPTGDYPFHSGRRSSRPSARSHHLNLRQQRAT